MGEISEYETRHNFKTFAVKQIENKFTLWYHEPSVLIFYGRCDDIVAIFETNKCHLREILIHFFSLKKFAAERGLFVEAYVENVLIGRSYHEWCLISFRTLNLKTKNVAEGPKLTNWKYYWGKIRIKCKENSDLH